MVSTVVSKGIFFTALFSAALSCAVSGSAAAYSGYLLQGSFGDMDPAQRDSAIHALTVRHFKYPAKPLLIRQLAEAYTAQKETDSALAYWRLLSGLQSDNDTALLAQAQLYYGKHKYDKAAAAAGQAAALRPDNADYLNLLAITDYLLHREAAALQACEKILSADSANVSALLLSGIILRNQKKNGEAMERFDRCLRADPANTEALLRRAEGYVLLKKYNAALRDYTAARADLDSDADVLNDIGVCYYESGSYQQAISYFDRAIRLDSLQPQSRFNKGLSYYHLNAMDTAYMDIKAAGDIWDSGQTDSGHADFLDATYYLAMCHKKTGDLVTARAYFELLRNERYPKDLNAEIKYIDYALFISRNWYYILLLLLLEVGLIVSLYKVLKNK